ncbi:MAG: hypothetical protein DRP67_03770 [Candidatus Omnitrophota bacterium]|nr:MAG: hypothetical protein DRP67_03770 [Candidatus Omnitrophota bacterium]
MEGKNLLLKLFLISLILHISILPLFSIVLPPKRKRYIPVEFRVYKPQIGKEKINLVEIEPFPKIPVVLPHYEKIFLSIEKEVFKKANEEITGLNRHTILTEIPENFKIAETRINIPSLPSIFGEKEKSAGKISEEIEGPGGKRRIIYKVSPEYPEWAKKEGIEGNVRIKFWISPQGKVVDTEIITSSGYPELDLIAEAFLRKWIFEPSTENYNVWGIITFRFRLE